ncbi:MAG: glycosyltransferase family 39 protein, partial [Bacteroidales bacterium]|nr:glycosyltransferase family 39 protein [Bacteroidales bacterium]
MEKIKSWISAYWIVLLFALAKLVVHLVTATNYGFQRDAYLYMAQSKHLDWGFFSTPPLVAFVTRIHTMLWGESLLAVRLLPALIGVISIFTAGWLIKQLKGGVMAQVIGLSAIFLSPAFLRTSALLQPTVFNHLFWLLAAVAIFQLVRKQEPKQLLWLIPVLALGWLAKYSIIFYASALMVALIISPHRKLLWSKYLPWTLAGGLLLILPNLYWQHMHNWPVISHMSELQDTQLGNMMQKDFLMAQLFMHLPAIPVWIGGLIWLIFNRKHRQFRLFAWAFGLTLLLIILLSGKFYYTIAAYTMLMVFGGIAWEQWATRPRRWIAWVVLALMISNGISSLPLSLPVYKPDQMVEYGNKMADLGLDVMFMWE